MRMRMMMILALAGVVVHHLPILLQQQCWVRLNLPLQQSWMQLWLVRCCSIIIIGGHLFLFDPLHLSLVLYLCLHLVPYLCLFLLSLHLHSVCLVLVHFLLDQGTKVDRHRWNQTLQTTVAGGTEVVI